MKNSVYFQIWRKMCSFECLSDKIMICDFFEKNYKMSKIGPPPSLGTVQVSADQISALFGPLPPYSDHMLIMDQNPSLPPPLSADHAVQNL